MEKRLRHRRIRMYPSSVRTTHELMKRFPQPGSINGLTPPESDMILTWLMDMVLRNHDLQCRFRWQGPNDMGELFSTHLFVA
jgi:hypothetical protein